MSSTVTGYPGSAVVTGYPASSVAPASYLNPNPTRNYPNDDRCVPVFIYALFAVITAGLIIGTAYEAYHPSLYFSVARFEVSNFSLSTSSLSSDFSASVSVRNPHRRWSVDYANVQAAVLYSTGAVDEAVLDTDAFVIAHASAFPFSQRGRDVTDLRVRLGAVGFYAADGDRIRSGDGEVRFGVRVSSTVRFKLMEAWKTGPHALRVYLKSAAPLLFSPSHLPIRHRPTYQLRKNCSASLPPTTM